MDRISFREWSTVPRRRWLLTGAAGVGFLLVGLAVFLSLGDHVLLMLSGMLALCTLLRCVAYYRAVRRGRYQTIEAIYIALGRVGIRRQRKVRLLLQDGRESVVTLDKRMHLRVEHQYRIFYVLASILPPGGADPQDPPRGGLFLALEDLGECRADAATDKMEKTALYHLQNRALR